MFYMPQLVRLPPSTKFTQYVAFKLQSVSSDCLSIDQFTAMFHALTMPYIICGNRIAGMHL